jgi:hypothetical protein
MGCVDPRDPIASLPHVSGNGCRGRQAVPLHSHLPVCAPTERRDSELRHDCGAHKHAARRPQAKHDGIVHQAVGLYPPPPCQSYRLPALQGESGNVCPGLQVNL